MKFLANGIRKSAVLIGRGVASAFSTIGAGIGAMISAIGTGVAAAVTAISGAIAGTAGIGGMVFIGMLFYSTHRTRMSNVLPSIHDEKLERELAAELGAR